jgi:hypothetical protein
VDANGALRAPILAGKTGKIWFADLFRVTRSASAPIRSRGYSLVTFYLNARTSAPAWSWAAPRIVPGEFSCRCPG